MIRKVLIAGLATTMLVACSADGRYVDTSDGQVDEQGGVTLIAPKTLAERIAGREAIQLIDVRTPEEFAQGHIQGAINIPVDSFDPAHLPDAGNASRILYCRSDRRSGVAAERLAQSGQTAVHVEGGILAWQAEGRPVTDPES